MNAPAEPLFHRIRGLVVGTCIGLLLLFIVIELVELIYGFGRAIFVTGDHAGRLLISSKEMAGLVPVFLNILISLTAITRHLLTADVFHGDPALNLSLAALVVAIAAAYFLIDRATPKSTP
jgi:Phosphate-starvation-inducible E family